MPYVRKTRDRYDIETNYGYGWETEYFSYEYDDARKTLADYRANAYGRFSSRLVKRREYLKAKEPPAITNADLFRAKTDEELAKTMEDTGECPPHKCPYDNDGPIARRDCQKCWLDWLKQEAEAP